MCHWNHTSYSQTCSKSCYHTVSFVFFSIDRHTTNSEWTDDRNMLKKSSRWNVCRDVFHIAHYVIQWPVQAMSAYCVWCETSLHCLVLSLTDADNTVVGRTHASFALSSTSSVVAKEVQHPKRRTVLVWTSSRHVRSIKTTGRKLAIPNSTLAVYLDSLWPISHRESRGQPVCLNICLCHTNNPTLQVRL